MEKAGRNRPSAAPKRGRILPGPSSMWLNAEGRRFPAPNFPGFDTLGTLQAIQDTGYDYSWFILTHKVIGKEFVLSGSEQNPDLTGKSIRGVLGRALSSVPGPGLPGPWRGFRHSRQRGRAGCRHEPDSRQLAHPIRRAGTAACRQRPRNRQQVLQRPANRGAPGSQELSRRQAQPYGGSPYLIRPMALSSPYCCGSSAQDAGRPPDRSDRAGARLRGSFRSRPLRRRRSGRLRRRRRARLPSAGGHLPRRLPVHRTASGTGALRAASLIEPSAATSSWRTDSAGRRSPLSS